MDNKLYKQKENTGNYKIMYSRKSELVEAVEDINNTFLLDYLNKSFYHKFTFANKNKRLFKRISELTFDNKYYINEIVLDGIRRKPYLDLETVYDNKKTFDKNFTEIVQNLQQDIITVFDTKYGKKITINDILLLDSSGQVEAGYKISLHIIVAPEKRTYYYTNSKSSASSAKHFRKALVELNSFYEKILDDQVYNTDVNFRIIGSSKKQNDIRILKPIDPETFEVLDLDSTAKLNYMLSYIDESKSAYKLTTPVVDEAKKPKHRQLKFNQPTTTKCDKKLLKLVQKHHPTAYSTGHNATFYNFNYTNRKEACPVSKLLHAGTNGFYCFETARGIYMKCHSSRCKDKVHLGYLSDSEEFINKAIQFDDQFLMNNANIKKIIKTWNNDKKILAIKSAMATGKTTTVKYILDTFEYKSILWISHRQTLSKSTQGSFEEYDFVSYLDVDGNLFHQKKVIVQVDSLMRIVDIDLLDDCTRMNIYDLVVIDEVEGCLNHFSSPFLNKPNCNARTLFEFMIQIMADSKKVLFLDADIDSRTQLVIEHFDNYIFINNNYMPTKKIFTITNNKLLFEKCLYDDATAKKNICIISMSSAAVEIISRRLDELKIKYVIHTSKTDDKLKDELKNVNDFWVDYQVVLYSPTIESGIDFNVEHFNKIYCIIVDGPMTCSQRSFSQMVGRIRKVESNDILCLYESIHMTDKCEPILNANIYTYKDVYTYYEHFEDLGGKKMLRRVVCKRVEKNGVIEITKKIYDIDLFDKISIYNEVEQLNKHPDIFVTVLKTLLTKAGHEVKFDLISKEQIKKNTKNLHDRIKSKDLLRAQLVNIDESKYDIPALIAKQSKSKLDEHEKLILKKYYFMKAMGFPKNTPPLLMAGMIEYFLGKEYKIYRYELLFGFKKLSDFDEDTFAVGKERVRQKIIVDFVNQFTNKRHTKLEVIDVYGKKISNNQYKTAVNYIYKNSIYFKDEEKYRAIFYGKKIDNRVVFKPKKDGPGSKSAKKSLANKQNYNHCINTIRRLLELYNIKLRVCDRFRNKNNGKNKSKGKGKGNARECAYSLSVDEQVMDIIGNKYGKENIFGINNDVEIVEI